MKLFKILNLFLVVFLLLAITCSDNSTEPEPIPTPPGYRLNEHLIDTELPCFVNIMFQVTDMDHKGVDDLTTDDFEVLEDSQPVSPTESYMQIRKRDIISYTLKTVLLIDNSVSVGDNLDEIKSAAITLINNITDQQEIAIYEFSDNPVLCQDFTDDVSLLTAAIEGINLGYATTNLYGAIIEGVSRWEDYYNLSEISQGFLIAFTDGSDTQGSHTLSEALSARGSKRVYTIGLGEEIESNILRQLGNAGFYSITDVNELAEKFTEIQSEMETYANSFYWLNYMSPKRGYNDHTLKLTIKTNINTGSDSYIEGSFSSADFCSVIRGIYINTTEYDPYGVDTVEINQGDSLKLEAITYLAGNPPHYDWSSSNNNTVDIRESINDNSVAYAFAYGDTGQTAEISIIDTPNQLSKTITAVITIINFEGFEGSGSDLPEDWSSTGSALWGVTDNYPYEGNYCVQSGDVSHNEYTELSKSYTVQCYKDATISFAQRVSSQTGVDFLKFFVNDVQKGSWSGHHNDWSMEYFNHYTGSNNTITLKWRYVKDDTISVSSDCSWIDNVSITW